MRAAFLVPLLLTGCLVRRPLPDAPPPTSTHETRRLFHPDGTLRLQYEVLVWSDGRVERDGSEREIERDGTLRAERSYRHGLPAGTWRAWFPGGSLRSEVEFGDPAVPSLLPSRYWHANGHLAAEGGTVAGVRQGPWRYWSESGMPLREGGYRDGRRDGPWVLYDAEGRVAERGEYAMGTRVGTWTLLDESGTPRERSSEAPASAEPDGDQ